MKAPIHVAITRIVKPGHEAAFERAILTFFAEAQESSATLGAQLLRPLPGSGSRTYGILRSFGSEQERNAFYESEGFLRWQEAVRPLVEEPYSRRDLHGLEAFFTNPGLIQRPPRWKMAFVTWLGVWPAVFLISSLVGQRFLSEWPFWIAAGFETMAVVAILTWGVMPALTRVFHPWLMKPLDARQPQRSRK
jgi:antibiotic biosynthesis monooxygenase (ABM) superfamily enzyme